MQFLSQYCNNQLRGGEGRQLPSVLRLNEELGKSFAVYTFKFYCITLRPVNIDSTCLLLFLLLLLINIARCSVQCNSTREIHVVPLFKTEFIKSEVGTTHLMIGGKSSITTKG